MVFSQCACKELLGEQNEDDDYARQLLQHAKKQKDPIAYEMDIFFFMFSRQDPSASTSDGVRAQVR